MQKLVADKREVFGKKTARLREQGFVPAVVYGGKHDPEAIAVKVQDLVKIYREAGESSVIDLEVKGSGRKNVLIHDISFDPVRSLPLHADFYEVSADTKVSVAVPLVFDGESDAVKSLGGILVKVMHEVEVEALPKDLPHEITVDLSALRNFEDAITLKDISTPHGVAVLGAEDAVVAKVTPPRSEEELAALEEQSTVSLENIEVAKKGKKEEEEAENASSEE